MNDNPIADLQGVVRIAKAASIGVTGNTPRLARAEAAIAAVVELIDANKTYDLALAALENFYRTITERGYLAAQIFNARELTEAFIRADDRRCKAVLAVAPLQGASA